MLSILFGGGEKRLTVRPTGNTTSTGELKYNGVVETDVSPASPELRIPQQNAFPLLKMAQRWFAPPYLIDKQESRWAVHFDRVFALFR